MLLHYSVNAGEVPMIIPNVDSGYSGSPSTDLGYGGSSTAATSTPTQKMSMPPRAEGKLRYA